MITVSFNSQEVYNAIANAALEVLKYQFNIASVIDVRIDGADLMHTFEGATVTISSGNEKVTL